MQCYLRLPDCPAALRRFDSVYEPIDIIYSKIFHDSRIIWNNILIRTNEFTHNGSLTVEQCENPFSIPRTKILYEYWPQ